MIVTPKNFEEVVDELSNSPVIGLDTETTGLRPYHGDRPFSIIMNGWYFDLESLFTYAVDYNDPLVPEPSVRKAQLRAEVIERPRIWVLFNAKFDMAMLEQAGFGRLTGEIHCAQVTERLLNDWDKKLSMEIVAPRYGAKKDDTVERYIDQHKLYTMKLLPGKKTPEKFKHYDRVPFDLIVPYGLKDVDCTLTIARAQRQKIRAIDAVAELGWPKLWDLYENERKLLPVVYEMEKLGVRVDMDYCRTAIDVEDAGRRVTAMQFEQMTGTPLVKSAKCFSEVFKDERWVYKKRKRKDGSFEETVCFDKEVLRTFKNPAAQLVLQNAQSKANINYYLGFLYHADHNGLIHTSFNQHAARTGRFSSSAPNLQNMKKDREGDDVENAYSVRRAIIPRDGCFFGMIDYDQVEYRMLADYAGALGLIELVKSGLDVHQATAEIAAITRDPAKNVNFGIVYGQGDESLGLKLHISTEEARALKMKVLHAAPEIKEFIKNVKERAVKRGFIFNWMGRRYRYDRSTSYKAVNGLIQGGAADVIKCAMIACDKFLREGGWKTRLVLTIHDELVFEGPKDELHVLPKLRDIMEGVFPHKYLKLTAGIDVSFKSLADKTPYEEVA